MNRSSAHTTAQRKGRERDLFTCQLCGSKTNAEGHHMIDYSFGGAADTDNIVTLCHDCHRDVHDGRIDLFKF